MAGQVTVGNIIGDTFSLVSDAGRDVGIYVLVIGGLTAIGVMLGVTTTSTSFIGAGFFIDIDHGLGSALFDLVAAVVGVAAGYWLLMRFLAARGRLASDWSGVWGYVGMSIVFTLGFVAGFLLFIIPGIMLLVRWSASSGFLIGSDCGAIVSLKASWRATAGHGWAIFLAGLVVLIAVSAATGVLGVVTELVGPTVEGVVSAFVEATMSAVLMAFGIAVYGLVDEAGEDLQEVFA